MDDMEFYSGKSSTPPETATLIGTVASGSWGSYRYFVIHGFHPRLLRSLTPFGVGKIAYKYH
ncbi:hypothetical protein SAMN04489724_2726 [Algoriphagus locisalis]|uniref:Uncharacterized protein n=1 Tax=Algoriphagus locisalis TaxID=305507 RepID=A0A1I7BUG2_9BACT|nr:hypothetical protein SAMN04489724_2726 [Algoriphagus locisalis]